LKSDDDEMRAVERRAPIRMRFDLGRNAERFNGR